MEDTAYFTLRAPSWKESTVMLLDYRIKAHNEISFSDAPGMEGTYYIDGETARLYPLKEITTKEGKKLVGRILPLCEIKFLKNPTKTT